MALRSKADRERAGRRLLILVSAVVFVDTMFYAVVAPLLPSLAAELHLSKASAGVLTAGYAVGTLLGSLPGGILAARLGPKPTVFSGLALLACSSVAFGFLHDVALLDLARLVQGVGGACSWAGGLAWILAEAPPDRRGGLIGRALGAAIGGALFGPVVGTIADAIGRRAVFSSVVVVAALLALEARRVPSTHLRSDQGLREVAATFRRPAVVIGMWLVTLPALASGVLNVLGPLRLHRFGAGSAAIGATFLVAAALEAAVSPAIGGLSDRRGRLVPLRLGLALATFVLVCFTLPGSVLLLAVVIAAIAAALGSFWSPAMAMLADAMDAEGLDQGLGLGLINLAWAAGQILGSAAGGALAKSTGDGLPVYATASLCLVTLLLLARRSALRADGWAREASPT
jgi:predicted MFS family arabinose efflux permease